MSVKLGDLVKDKITGVEGVVFGIGDWLYGCRSITVKRTQLKEDGTAYDNQTFDEPQLTVIQEGYIKRPEELVSPPLEVAAPRKTTGGPDRPMPRSR